MQVVAHTTITVPQEGNEMKTLLSVLLFINIASAQTGVGLHPIPILPFSGASFDTVAITNRGKHAIPFNILNSSGTSVAKIDSSGLINGQTISSAANFTGSLTAAATITSNDILGFAIGTFPSHQRIQYNAGEFDFLTATDTWANLQANTATFNGNLTVNWTGSSYFAGSVGIGTTAPTRTLTVNSPTNALIGLESADVEKMIIGYSSTFDGFDIANAGVADLFIVQRTTGNVGIKTVAPIATLDDSGSFATRNTSQSVSYIAGAADNTIYMTAPSAADTVFLPTAVGISGLWYKVMKTDATANNVVVRASGAELINGANSYALTAQYKYITVQSNGTQWYIWGSN